MYFLSDTIDMLAKFLKHSGHMERAVSLYQAMIEFNLFCPDVLKQVDKVSKLHKMCLHIDKREHWFNKYIQIAAQIYRAKNSQNIS